MRLFEFMSVLHKTVFRLIAGQILNLKMVFLCAIVVKSDLVNFFFFFCLFSTKMKVHVFKGRKLPEHADRPFRFCDVFCRSMANL